MLFRSDQELAVVMQPLPAARTEPEASMPAKHKPKEKRAPGSTRRRGDFRGFNDL